MAVGPKPAFPPTFVQSLLDLPHAQLDKLVNHLDKHIIDTERLLKVEDNFKAFNVDYENLGKKRSEAYEAYNSQIDAENSPAARRSMSAAGADDSPAEKTPASERVSPTRSLDYDRTTQALHKLVTKVECIKDKMKELLGFVKISSKESLDAVTDLYNQFSAKKLADQHYLDLVVAHANDLVLGTQADDARGTPAKFGVLHTIRESNKQRKAALNAFVKARVLHKTTISPSDQKVQDLMSRAGMTADFSKELRSLCQNLADADLDKIFGKTDSAARKEFASLIEAGKTRDVAKITTLANVLGNNPDASRKLIRELLERTNETRTKTNSYNPFAKAIRIPNLILNGRFDVEAAQKVKLDADVEEDSDLEANEAALKASLEANKTKLSEDLDAINTANQKTLSALALALTKPDLAFGKELIKLGDEALAKLLLIHIEDEDSEYRIISELPLNELVSGLALVFHERSQPIPSAFLEKLIKDSEDKASAVTALKSVKKALKEYKTPIELNLPWSIYSPSLLLGIDTYSAVFSAATLIGCSIGKTEMLAPLASATVVTSLTALAARFVYQSRANIPGYNTLIETPDKLGKLKQVIEFKPLYNKVFRERLGLDAFSAGCFTTALVGYYLLGRVEALSFLATDSVAASLAGLGVLKTAYPFRANIPGYNRLIEMRDNLAEKTGLNVFYDKLTGFYYNSKAASVKTVSPLVPVKPAVTTTRVFERATLPTVFDVIKPEDTDSYAHKVHAGIETIFSPLSKFFKICNEKAEGFFGSEEESSKMIAHLCAKWDIDPTNIANCSTMVAHLEALFNWGGRIPYVCALTGMGRIAIGLIEAAAASAIGLWTIAFSKNEEASLVGQSILKQYALKQGFGNVARGIFESTSWAISIMTNLPRDLLGIRWSYEGERASDMNITPMFNDLINEVQKKVKEARA